MDIKLSKFIVSLLAILFFVSSFLNQKTVVVRVGDNIISVTTFKRRVYDLFDDEITNFSARDVKNVSLDEVLREGMIIELEK